MSATVRIRYIPLPDGEEKKNLSSRKAERRQRRDTLMGVLGQRMREEPGGLEFLRLRCMEAAGYAYYSGPAEGILADFMNLGTLEDCPREVTEWTFGLLDKEKAMRVCHLKAGLLHEDEYKRLSGSAAAEEREALEALPAAVIAPSGGEETCRFYGEEETVYGIPIFRCAWDREWKKPQDEWELLHYLISKGFLPDFVSIGILSVEEAWRDLTDTASPAQPLLLKADPKGNTEEQNRWKHIVKFYREIGRHTADLADYPDSVLQVEGSWDLYPFVGLTQEDLRPEDGPWCEVSGLCARDPREDLVSDAEYVAIDFGTTSTVAAVYQDNGSITTMPVGGGRGRGQTDNPTILRFMDLDSFLKAYEEKEFRPGTKYTQVSSSYNAWKDFESPDKREHTLQYLNQLKQWVNNPDRTIRLTDRDSGRAITLGRKMQRESLTVDPIELYAYYIGLSLNDMRWGKIYRKYLLSYSATYSEYSREWIRSSFEKGLRKSLPWKEGEAAELDVQLWQNEAMCYAVCAMNYSLLAKETDARELEQDIFYGVYDFGGGTLDFSFGVMTLDPKTEVQHFKQLQCGGSPVMGCENILDELAFSLFSKNHEKFRKQKKKIRCAVPIGADPRQHLRNPIVGESEAARYNTCSLTAYLREKWIDKKKTASEDGDELPDTLKLKDEDGNTYEWAGKAVNGGKDTIEMDISDDEIENFFEEKVKEGISLFLECWQNVCSEEKGKTYRNRPCHVFLAGSASQADRVKRLFKVKTQEVEDGGKGCPHFEIHPPLPTEEAQKAQKKDSTLDIPTAKSGVAYGLLMSRPGAEEIIIDKHDWVVGFHYHIGRKVRSSQNGVRGMFRLLAKKEEIPKREAGIFRLLRKIPKQIFELLYTFDDSFAMTASDREINGSIRVLTLRMPEDEAWEDQFLYIRAMSSSGTSAEVGVSSYEDRQLEAGQVRIVGECDFARGTFTLKEQAAQAVPPPLRAEEKTLPVPPKNPYVPKSPPAAGTGGHCVLGFLPAKGGEPVWRADTAKLRTKTFLGDFQEDSFVLCWKEASGTRWEELPVALEGSGTKRVFLLEAAPPLLRFRSGTAAREQYVFTVNLNTRGVQKEDKGGLQ